MRPCLLGHHLLAVCSAVATTAAAHQSFNAAGMPATPRSGKVDAYAVFNLTARYRFAENWEVFARIDNLFDTDYETAAILAENVFDAADQFQSDPDDWRRETFFAPGAPRAIWVGVRFVIGRMARR